MPRELLGNIKGEKGDQGAPGKDGVDGAKGAKGEPGAPGKDGVTPTFELEANGDLYVVTPD